MHASKRSLKRKWAITSPCTKQKLFTNSRTDSVTTDSDEYLVRVRASVDYRDLRLRSWQIRGTSLLLAFGPRGAEVASRVRAFSDAAWILCWRDITSALDERTVIAAVLPVVATDFTLRVGFPQCRGLLSASLLAALNSFIFDYCARQKIGGTHLADFVFKQLPLLNPSDFEDAAPWDGTSSLSQWIVSRVLELSYSCWDIQGFAKELNWDGPPFAWDEERRAILRAELDVVSSTCTASSVSTSLTSWTRFRLFGGTTNRCTASTGLPAWFWNATTRCRRRWSPEFRTEEYLSSLWLSSYGMARRVASTEASSVRPAAAGGVRPSPARIGCSDSAPRLSPASVVTIPSGVKGRISTLRCGLTWMLRDSEKR